jgi:hypothetical protein
MSTGATNQQSHVIAKDLLIAALQDNQISLSSDPTEGAEELAGAFSTILKGVREAMASRR